MQKGVCDLVIGHCTYLKNSVVLYIFDWDTLRLGLKMNGVSRIIVTRFQIKTNQHAMGSFFI